MNIDLHLHSNYSDDAIIRPETVLKIAKEKDLNIAITDHNTTKAWPLFKTLSKKFQTEVILGEEVTVFKGKRVMGHFIGLFMQEEIKSREYLDVIDEIHSQDALLMVAHPFDSFRTPCKCLDEIIKEIDLIEAFNARSYLNKFNIMAEEFALKNNLARIAASDAHTPGEIGSAYTFVRADNLEEARGELVKGNTQVFGKKSGLMPHILTQLAQLNLIRER